MNLHPVTPALGRGEEEEFTSDGLYYIRARPREIGSAYQTARDRDSRVPGLGDALWLADTFADESAEQMRLGGDADADAGESRGPLALLSVSPPAESRVPGAGPDTDRREFESRAGS